jgi:hypothetical protein
MLLAKATVFRPTTTEPWTMAALCATNRGMPRDVHGIFGGNFWPVAEQIRG